MCVVGFSAPAGRNDCHGLSLAEGYPAPSGAKKSVTNPRVNEIREKIKSVASALSVIDFERWRKSP